MLSEVLRALARVGRRCQRGAGPVGGLSAGAVSGPISNVWRANRSTGRAGARRAAHKNVPRPRRAIAGQLVQQDLCTLQQVEGVLRLMPRVPRSPQPARRPGGCSRASPLPAIHEPVPRHMPSAWGKPVDRFIGMLASDTFFAPAVAAPNLSATPAILRRSSSSAHGRARYLPGHPLRRNVGNCRFPWRVQRQASLWSPRTGAVFFVADPHPPAPAGGARSDCPEEPPCGRRRRGVAGRH